MFLHPVPFNPVVVPIWADPMVWGTAALGMAAEIAVVQQLLRRHGDVTPHAAGPLFVANTCTFTLFVLWVHLFSQEEGPAIWLHVVWLEIAVILVEAQILGWLVQTGRVFRDRASVTLTVRQALGLSLCGNATSTVGPFLIGLLVALARI